MFTHPLKILSSFYPSINPDYIGHSRASENLKLMDTSKGASSFLVRVEFMHENKLVAHAFTIRIKSGRVEVHEPMRAPPQYRTSARNKMVKRLLDVMEFETFFG